MLPKYHFLLGIAFVTLLHFIFPQITFLNLSIIFLSSFLIDVDHIIYSFIKQGTLSPIKAYQWCIKKMKKILSLPKEKRKKIYSGFYLFHGVEWLIILFLLGIYISPFFIFICIGFSFHLLVDTFYEIFLHMPLYKFSVILSFLRLRKTN